MSTIIAQQEPRIASITVEAPCAAGATRVSLPDVQQLKNTATQIVIIKAIRVLTPKVLANGILTAAANMTLADLRNAVVTFYCEGWEKGKSIPLLVLNDMADNDATTATTIPYKNSTPTFSNWQNVDWAQSYVQFCAGQTAAGAGVFMFDVQYLKLNPQKYQQNIWEEIVGPS